MQPMFYNSDITAFFQGRAARALDALSYSSYSNANAAALTNNLDYFSMKDSAEYAWLSIIYGLLLGDGMLPGVLVSNEGTLSATWDAVSGVYSFLSGSRLEPSITKKLSSFFDKNQQFVYTRSNYKLLADNARDYTLKLTGGWEDMGPTAIISSADSEFKYKATIAYQDKNDYYYIYSMQKVT